MGNVHAVVAWKRHATVRNLSLFNMVICLLVMMSIMKTRNVPTNINGRLIKVMAEIVK